MRRLAAFFLFLAPLAAAAHDADIIYTRIQREPDGRVVEISTMTAQSLALLAPVDSDGDGNLTEADLSSRKEAIEAGVWNQMPLSAGGQECQRTGTSATLGETFVELTARFQCPPGELR